MPLLPHSSTTTCAETLSYAQIFCFSGDASEDVNQPQPAGEPETHGKPAKAEPAQRVR